MHFRRLYRQVFQSMCDGKALIWLAELAGVGLIGQLFVQLKSSRFELADGKQRAYIYGFRIKPNFRGKGLGRMLLQIVEADLLVRKYQWATLNVGFDNPQALRFYERLGYQVIGEEPGQWSYIDHLGNRQHVSEPAWRMQKQIQ